MAGVGSTLRKLIYKDDLIGAFQAFFNSSIISTGPWLMTIIAIGVISIYGASAGAFFHHFDFHTILIYNFAFTMIFCTPISVLLVRNLADSIFLKNITNTTSTLIFGHVLLLAITLPVAGWFYFHFVDIALELRLLAFVNFFLILFTWLIHSFVSAVKKYNLVTAAFLTGMTIGVVIAVYLKPEYADKGMLLGFNVGIGIVFFVLLSVVLSEYDFKLKKVQIYALIKKYWQIALGCFFYVCTIWVDKFVMALAPEATTTLVTSKMPMYFEYGNAMFFAALTMVPALAIFLLQIETDFAEKYHRFYIDIIGDAPLRKIENNHNAIREAFIKHSVNLVLLQAFIAFLAITLAPKIFELLDIRLIVFSMYRFGVLGAFFHILTFLIIIILYYFDCRTKTLIIQLLFLITNAIFTYITIKLGFTFYGYGYFFSALVTFMVALPILIDHIEKLPFHTFIYPQKEKEASSEKTENPEKTVKTVKTLKTKTSEPTKPKSDNNPKPE